jgi:hypothetical protein
MRRTSSKNESWKGITLSGSKLEERKAIGRPRLRWLEVTEKDLRKMRFEIWRLKGTDREQWASVIEDARLCSEGGRSKE